MLSEEIVREAAPGLAIDSPEAAWAFGAFFFCCYAAQARLQNPILPIRVPVAHLALVASQEKTSASPL